MNTDERRSVISSASGFSLRITRVPLLVAALACGLARAQAPASVGVCDLFRNLPAWNGKMVSFAAVIEAFPESREEGPWISAVDCPDKLQVKGVDFADTINIANPRLGRPLIDHPVSFDWDFASWRELNRLVSRIDGQTDDIRATVVGLFETRVPTDDLIVATRAHPEGLRAGYGHGGRHPAQLVVKTTIDMRIEKKRQSQQVR